MPGVLQWAWSSVRPLYAGPAAAHAEAVRGTLRLPVVPALSREVLAAAGIDRTALKGIRTILDSYYHTNALALVVLSALLEHYDPSATEPGHRSESVAVAQSRPNCRHCRRWRRCHPRFERLIEELNGFGEDTDPFLIASMYRHLAYWPPYLAIVRTMLAPLQADGSLNALTHSARATGRAHGQMLARQLAPGRPPRIAEGWRLPRAGCSSNIRSPGWRESAPSSGAPHRNEPTFPT